jgi:hypothetical protein
MLTGLLGVVALCLPSALSVEKAAAFDDSLDTVISIDWQHTPLEQVVEDLRKSTRTNLVVNWPALAAAGITRQTPVTLHLKAVPYEAVVRSVLRVLAPQEQGLNYVVGENALEITTNAALGNAPDVHLYPVGPLLQKKLVAPSPDILAQRAATLMETLHAALRIAGESASSFTLNDGLLAVNTSPRGHTVLQHMLTQLESPLARNTVLPAAAESVRAKHTIELLKSLADSAGKVPLAALATTPSAMNVLMLPGARAHMGQSGAPLDDLIDEAGIVEIGTPDEIARRTLPSVYDLSDLLRRRMLRSHAALEEEFPRVIAELQTQLPGVNWGPLRTSLCSMTPYAQELIVFAPATLHRQIAAALQTMYK